MKSCALGDVGLMEKRLSIGASSFIKRAALILLAREELDEPR